MRAHWLRRAPALFSAGLLVVLVQLLLSPDSLDTVSPEGAPMTVEGVLLPPVSPGPEFLQLHLAHEPSPMLPCDRLEVTVTSSVSDLTRFFDPPLAAGEIVSFRTAPRLPTYYLVPGVSDSRLDALKRGCGWSFHLKSPIQLRRLGLSWWGRIGAPLLNYEGRFSHFLRERLPAGAAELSLAVLLGESRGVDAGVRLRALELGVWHLYIVSGFHVAVLAVLARFCCRPLPLGSLWVATVVWSYVLLIGSPPSALRAALAISLFLALSAVGLRSRPANALGLVVIMVFVWNPLTLLQPGFHFTAACLLALVLALPLASSVRRILKSSVAPVELLTSVHTGAEARHTRRLRFHLQHRFHHQPSVLTSPLMRWSLSLLAWVLPTLTASLAIQLFVLPLSLFYGNLVVPTAALSNLLLLPLVSLLICGLVALFALYWSPLGDIVASLVVGLARGFEWTAARLADVTAASYQPHPDAIQLWLYWAALLGLIFWSRRQPARLAALPLATLLLLPAPSLGGDGLLHMTMLDVGQGESIHLQYPDGSHGLIDSGGLLRAFDPTFMGRRVVGRYLWSKRIRRLDLALLSHLDADHSQGYQFLLGRFPVMRFASSSPFFKPGPGLPPNELLGKGVEFSHGGVTHTLLNPESPQPLRAGNDESLVVHLQFGAVTLLMTGDITRKVERRLLDQLGPVTILKVAHHGSRTSTTESFVKRICPRLALISAGRFNLFGHPAGEVVKRLEDAGTRVLTTAERGSLRVTTDGRKWWVETFDGKWRPVHQESITLPLQR